MRVIYTQSKQFLQVIKWCKNVGRFASIARLLYVIVGLFWYWVVWVPVYKSGEGVRTLVTGQGLILIQVLQKSFFEKSVPLYKPLLHFLPFTSNRPAVFGNLLVNPNDPQTPTSTGLAALGTVLACVFFH